MRKIDWNPGLGRHGRPIRTLVGITQRQGLIVLSVLSGVMVLLAGYAAIGGFDHPVAAATSSAGRASGGGSGGPGGGPAVVTSSVSPVPADPAKASKLLLASTQHFADMFAAGQKIVGHTRYADMRTLSQAVANKNSPAAQLIAYRDKPNPEADVTYTTALNQASQAFGTGTRPSGLEAWSTDMGKVHSDLTSWIGIAAQYQSSAATQADLDAAAAAVTADLTAAKADATKIASS
jgi:hypothetical protein